jgi:hypothetical protein
MPIEKPDRFKSLEAVNTDSYSKCCVDIAREVMRLLDTAEYADYDVHKIICDAEHNIGESGITGFMSAMIANMVISYHSRGEEFRLKWNSYYNVPEKKAKGRIVNPAILIISD